MSPPRDTEERILDAASELFATHGYTATSTRAIAERAGVNEVTLFRRFENKLGILKALGARFMARSAGFAAAAAPDPDDVRGTLLQLARLEISSAMQSGGLALRLAFDARSVPEVKALLGEGPSANLEALAAYVAEHQATGDLRGDLDSLIIAEAFFSLTSSFVMYRTIIGAAQPPADIDTDEGIAQLFELFWTGVAGKGHA